MKWLEELNLPTDNLYRFMALFGLLSTIFCFVYIPILTEKNNKSAGENNQIFAELSADLNFYQSKILDKRRLIPKTLKTTVMDYTLLNNGDILKKDSELQFYIFPIINSSSDTIYNKNIAELNKLSHMVAKNQYKFDALKEYRETINKNHRISIRYLKILGFISTILCALGMILWYKKYQKYLDFKLKNEAAESA